LHIRTIPLGESKFTISSYETYFDRKCIAVMRVAYQAETGTIWHTCPTMGYFFQMANGLQDDLRYQHLVHGQISLAKGLKLLPVDVTLNQILEPEVAIRKSVRSVFSMPTHLSAQCEQHSLYVKVFDFKFSIQVHELGKFETMQSLASLKLGNDPTPYFAIGTATVHDDEDEVETGFVKHECIS